MSCVVSAALLLQQKVGGICDWAKVASFGQNTFVCAAFCPCLQVSFMEQPLMLSGRKIFTLFYQSISRTEKLLIPTIVAHSRRDISP